MSLLELEDAVKQSVNILIPNTEFKGVLGPPGVTKVRNDSQTQ